jgi:hypothetical protein
MNTSTNNNKISGPGNGGVGGVLGGYRSLAHLAQALSAYFLPNSYASAPLGSEGGNRTIVLTNKTVQATVTSLVSGIAIWKFTAPFNTPPVVMAMPIGPPSAGTPALYVVAPGPTPFGVTVQSTLGTDARPVMLVAIGNPN